MIESDVPLPASEPFTADEERVLRHVIEHALFADVRDGISSVLAKVEYRRMADRLGKSSSLSSSACAE